MDAFGVAEFVVGNRPVRAILNHDRTWTIECEDATVREQVQFHLDGIAALPHGPADGFYGPRQLKTATQLFGGSYILEPREVGLDNPPDPTAAKVAKYLGVKLFNDRPEAIY